MVHKKLCGVSKKINLGMVGLGAGPRRVCVRGRRLLAGVVDLQRRVIAWAPAFLWAGLLIGLSSFREVPRIVSFAVNDKLVHLVVYSVLGLTLAWGKRYGRSNIPHLALIALGAMYGAIDETYQRLVPGRIPDMADFFADALGVTVSYSLLAIAWWAICRARKGETA